MDEILDVHYKVFSDLDKFMLLSGVLSTAAIAGTAVGVVLAAVVLVALTATVMYRKRTTDRSRQIEARQRKESQGFGFNNPIYE